MATFRKKPKNLGPPPPPPRRKPVIPSSGYPMAVSGALNIQPVTISEEAVKEYKLKQYHELKAELAQLYQQLLDEGLLTEENDEFEIQGNL